MRIDIYSEAVHSGKSSRLLSWYQMGYLTHGFICPDIYENRYFLHIHSGSLIPFQLKTAVEADSLLIGKYSFLKQTFVKARNTLLEMHQALRSTEENDIWVVDEIGKLELRNEGLEPALHTFLQEAKTSGRGKLILVIRDYLLDQVIEKYDLGDQTIYGHEHYDL